MFIFGLLFNYWYLKTIVLKQYLLAFNPESRQVWCEFDVVSDRFDEGRKSDVFPRKSISVRRYEILFILLFDTKCSFNIFTNNSTAIFSFLMVHIYRIKLLNSNCKCDISVGAEFRL